MRSVATLSASANNYEFSTQVPFRTWAHVSRTILRQARIYDAEQDWENAYVLYLRYADLVLNRLPKHPGFKSSNKLYEPLLAQINPVITAAETIRSKLDTRKEPPSASTSDTEITHGAPRNSTTGHAHAADTAQQSTPLTQFKENRELDLAMDSEFEATLSSLKQGPDAFSRAVQGQRSMPRYPQVPQTANGAKAPGVDSVEVAGPLEHKPIGSTESGVPLRNLFLPETMRAKFLDIAEPNTLRNLETAGILCGKLNRHALFVTHLIVPPQESTENTCTTTDEEALFEYVEKEDLFILGWIHTHPTQSCFMSSVDLHTQAAYQIMLPEAIAVVCAPMHEPSWGVFRLTDPTGIDIIKNCRRSGFHPHHERNLYKHALPGHVVLYDFAFASVDLRKGTA